MLTIKFTQKETLFWFIIIFVLFVSNFMLIGYLTSVIHNESHLAKYNTESLKYASEYAKWNAISKTFKPALDLNYHGNENNEP